MMKEVKIREVLKFIDPMSLEEKPAIALADNGKRINGLTIGWGGFGVLWNKPCATIYIHKTRFSKEIFDAAEGFSINWLKEKDRNVLGFFGSVSGRDEDKMKKCGLPSLEYNGIPYFKDAEAVVFCRIMGRTDFRPQDVDAGVRNWYQEEGVHTIYEGEITRVLVKE